MKLREQFRRARLRRDLRRFSAVARRPGLLLPENRRRQLKNFFAVEPGRIPFSLPVDRNEPPPRLEDLDPRRLYHSPDPAETAALWALSLGFFPVIVLEAGPGGPSTGKPLCGSYSLSGVAGLWRCGCTGDELDRVLSSRHVVGCAGIDVIGRIREFYS